MDTPAPAPTSAEQPGACLLHVPSQGRESGAREEGSERTEEACFLPGPHPLSAPGPPRKVRDTSCRGERRADDQVAGDWHKGLGEVTTLPLASATQASPFTLHRKTEGSQSCLLTHTLDRQVDLHPLEGPVCCCLQGDRDPGSGGGFSSFWGVSPQWGPLKPLEKPWREDTTSLIHRGAQTTSAQHLPEQPVFQPGRMKTGDAGPVRAKPIRTRSATCRKATGLTWLGASSCPAPSACCRSQCSYIHVPFTPCQAVFQHLTCITGWHSFNNNWLSTDNVPDTILDISSEQSTPKVLLSWKDTPVLQQVKRPCRVLEGLRVSGKIKRERIVLWEGVSVAQYNLGVSSLSLFCR